MNYMAKQVIKEVQNDLKEVRHLSEAIGDFIEYWGFRRIHGQIWGQVFMSKRPLSGSDLTTRLNVSKALVSPALKQLLDYELIFEVESLDSRKKLYEANPDFMSVIRKVIKTREVPLLQKVQNKYVKLETAVDKSLRLRSELDMTKVKDLGSLILQANLAVAVMAQMNSFSEIEQLMQMYKEQVSFED
jgi:DNA-binding transcriptional regulator GbsR (MarR family)